MVTQTDSFVQKPSDTPEPTARQTWTLTPAEYAATAERVSKINARAAKRGFTGSLGITGAEREVSERDTIGFSRTYVVMDTEITGEAPCYNGWAFLAAVDTIELEEGAAYVLRAAPGIDVSTLDRSLLLPGQCQHCHTTRNNRIYTYLVRNVETGETMQVGSTCIKDFTGWAGKPVFISTEELAHELDGLGGSSGTPPEFTPETVVAIAWGISRVFGWVSTSAAYEGHPATRNLVEAFLYGTSKADNELRAEVGPAVNSHRELAQTIIATLLEDLAEDGGYGSNMLACLRASFVQPQHMGLVVSSAAAYERVIGSRVRRELKETSARESKYAGTPGEKITVAGRITRLLPIENNYGYHPTTSMLVIVENDQTVAKMFTTAKWSFEVAQGEEITITGTVKDHEEYQGVKQTILTRPGLAKSH